MPMHACGHRSACLQAHSAKLSSSQIASHAVEKWAAIRSCLAMVTPLLVMQHKALQDFNSHNRNVRYLSYTSCNVGYPERSQTTASSMIGSEMMKLLAN